MKTFSVISILAAGIFLGSHAYSQTFEITPFSGYTFQTGFDITGGGRATLNGNANFGLMVGYTTGNDVTEFEFSYTHFGTNAVASSDYLVEDVTSRANLNFYLLGINRLLQLNPKTTFFGGVKLGLGDMTFSEGNNMDRSRFTAGVQSGIKHYVSNRVGLRFQANLLLPIVNDGGSMWWNPNTGTNISGWSPIVPFSLNVGFIYRIYR